MPTQSTEETASTRAARRSAKWTGSRIDLSVDAGSRPSDALPRRADGPHEPQVGGERGTAGSQAADRDAAALERRGQRGRRGIVGGPLRGAAAGREAAAKAAFQASLLHGGGGAARAQPVRLTQRPGDVV